MKEPSPRQNLELAFRRKLFKLIDQYLNFPEDAMLGKINRTLVNFSNLVSALNSSAEVTVSAVENAWMVEGSTSFDTWRTNGSGTSQTVKVQSWLFEWQTAPEASALSLRSPKRQPAK